MGALTYCMLHRFACGGSTTEKQNQQKKKNANRLDHNWFISMLDIIYHTHNHTIAPSHTLTRNTPHQIQVIFLVVYTDLEQRERKKKLAKSSCKTCSKNRWISIDCVFVCVRYRLVFRSFCFCPFHRFAHFCMAANAAGNEYFVAIPKD